jgi:hypothetical protein
MIQTHDAGAAGHPRGDPRSVRSVAIDGEAVVGLYAERDTDPRSADP